MKHIVIPEGFHVELFAAEPDIGGKPICMTWDERGRLWVCETVDYPNELQPARRRPRPHSHLRRHRRRRPGRQVHRLRRKLSIPTSHRPSPRRRHRPQRPADAVPEGHRRRRQGRRPRRCYFGLDTDATRTAARATCSMASTTGSGACRATTTPRLEVGGEEHSSSARASTASSRTARKLEFLRSTNNNTWGWASARRGSSSARPPTAIPASTCRSPTATTSRSAAGRRR